MVVVVAVDEEEFDSGVGKELIEAGVEAALLGPRRADGEIADVEEQVDAFVFEGADGGAGGAEVPCQSPATAKSVSLMASPPRARWRARGW